MKVIGLMWSDVQNPNKECPYTHITAKTPFGRFLITWKGWKENAGFDATIDETPWGEWCGVGCSVEEAKQTASDEYEKRVLMCITEARDKQ